MHSHHLTHHNNNLALTNAHFLYGANTKPANLQMGNSNYHLSNHSISAFVAAILKIQQRPAVDHF